MTPNDCVPILTRTEDELATLGDYNLRYVSHKVMAVCPALWALMETFPESNNKKDISFK